MNHRIKILIKSSLFMFLILPLIFIYVLSGCKAGESSEEISVTEQEEGIEGEELEESAETGDGTGEDTVAGTEITGNINILSGLEISDTVGSSRPIAIMVDNDPRARLQSGLIYADIVFEAVDEGGVTRYVAIYSSHDAEIVGPVRSARIYYAEIARSFDPLYAFWGTYEQAYDAIAKIDMDILDGNSDIIAYTDSGWRDYSRSIVDWCTAFMSTVKLKEDALDHGYSLVGGQSPLRFKADAVDSEKGNVSNIAINFSNNNNFKINFEYNKEENIYYKYLAGSPHKDYETGKQISVNNVIVMITDIGGPIDPSGHMVIRTTGTSDMGKAFYFMDGTVVEGTWERTSAFDPFLYRNSNGDIVLFNRGSTWVAMIQDKVRLTY